MLVFDKIKSYLKFRGGKYQGYHQMLEMSRSIHDIQYQGDICMLRIDSDIQLVGTDMQNHAGKGNRCKLANRRKVTLCWWLWKVISKMLQQRTTQSRKAQEGSHDACVCTFLCALGCFSLRN